MTDDTLRARYETWANAQNPPEGDCSCGQPMDAHSGGMALLHHDYHDHPLPRQGRRTPNY